MSEHVLELSAASLAAARDGAAMLLVDATIEEERGPGVEIHVEWPQLLGRYECAGMSFVQTEILDDGRASGWPCGPCS